MDSDRQTDRQASNSWGRAGELRCPSYETNDPPTTPREHVTDYTKSVQTLPINYNWNSNINRIGHPLNRHPGTQTQLWDIYKFLGTALCNSAASWMIRLSISTHKHTDEHSLIAPCHLPQSHEQIYQSTHNIIRLPNWSGTNTAVVWSSCVSTCPLRLPLPGGSTVKRISAYASSSSRCRSPHIAPSRWLRPTMEQKDEQNYDDILPPRAGPQPLSMRACTRCHRTQTRTQTYTRSEASAYLAVRQLNGTKVSGNERRSAWLQYSGRLLASVQTNVTSQSRSSMYVHI